MRNRFDRLLAGTVLALIVAAPTLGIAAPDRVRSVGPLPPSLNGQTPPRHQAAPMPPPRREAAPVSPPAAPPAPAAAAAPATDTDSFDNNGASDKLPLPSDAQIADRLRTTVTAKQFDKHVGREPERQAIEAFYAGRGYAPLWISDGRLNARAKAAIARLKNAAADGLDAPDYPVPEFGNFTGAEALADSDIKLTNSVLTFARHLAVGRIAPTRVLSEVDYGSHTPEPADILRKIAEAHDENATLESFNPPHAGFRALKEKLAELRAPSAQADNRIPDGPLLKPGMKDARVPLLRERLGIAGKADDLVYDRKIFNAIKSVQQHADLRPTSLTDGKTLAVLKGPKPGKQIETILANMERWRWLPRDLGRSYVMVNIPDFTLKVVHDHQLAWRTEIVAGKPQTPTPLLSASMDSVIVNPSWHVPQSIIQNELLPRYSRDPNIFNRMGLQVKRGSNGHITVVQPPGAANALGRIKFNFPNNFQVYLHDTPQKRLFKYDRRAFSHGCMRVEDPTKFAEIMLHLAMNGPTPNSQQLYSLFGHDERTFKLTNRPTVHLTYQTAFVDDAGKLELRDDLYGIDARIQAILRSDERRIAGLAPPKDPKRVLATLQSNREILRRVERREALNSFAFFERLFR